MNHLFSRPRAPITPAGWEEIEKEGAAATLARLCFGGPARVVRLQGPRWVGAPSDVRARPAPIRFPSPPSGKDVTGPPAPHPAAGPSCAIAFDVSRAELDANRSIAARAIPDLDFGKRWRPSRWIAIAEGPLDFSTAMRLCSDHGYLPEALETAARAVGQQPCRLSARWSRRALAKFCATRGIEGSPLQVVAETSNFTRISLGAHRRRPYPIISPRPAPGRWRHCLGRPGIDGGLVISQRGGDFELSVGQDFSIGLSRAQPPRRVRLYIGGESFTFLILTEQAGDFPLKHGQDGPSLLRPSIGTVRLAMAGTRPNQTSPSSKPSAVYRQGRPRRSGRTLCRKDTQDPRAAHVGALHLLGVINLRKRKIRREGNRGLRPAPEACNRTVRTS